MTLTLTMLSGLGLAPSLNLSDSRAMAQAQHDSAPDIAGRGIANPSSLIGSAAMLLDWIGRRNAQRETIEAGTAIRRGIDTANATSETRCRDLGGPLSTHAFAQHVADNL